MKNWLSGFVIAFLCFNALGQATDKPIIRSTSTDQAVRVDGWLDEADWARADSITALYMVEPVVNGTPSFQTIVKILLTPKNIYLGIICMDDQPEDIVAFSKARDSELEDEDYLKVILDTYRDGRSGYIFAINPFAARYDALVSNNGESENPNWDGAWDAQTRIGDDFWSAEIRIPVSTLTYNKSLDSWGFNVERRIQRFLEVNRWSGISMDYTIGQTRHAGLITDLPGFNSGIGLTPRASLVSKITQDGENKAVYDWKPSLDLTQRITTDITAQLTVNTDFAETEVDSRQTNLTRFPVLYPEKRQFFLEGADIYDFGLSLGRSLMPFYSRRIGLYQGNEVPILWGGKVNGKVKKTYFGSLFTQTGAVDSLVSGSKMGVVRIKQNILKESSLGMIASMGDPGARNQAWTAGVDFTYQTSSLRSSSCPGGRRRRQGAQRQEQGDHDTGRQQQSAGRMGTTFEGRRTSTRPALGPRTGIACATPATAGEARPGIADVSAASHLTARRLREPGEGVSRGPVFPWVGIPSCYREPLGGF